MILKRKLLLAINPHAGKSSMKNKLMSVVQRFTQGGYEVTVFTTQRAGQLPEYIRENAGRFDLIVCSGGDGTMSEAVNGLMRCENPPRLGYIPAGTTNDFANSLGLSKNPEVAANDIMEGLCVPVDVGQFGEDYFSYVAAFGAFTDVTYETPQSTKSLLGHAAYVLEGAKRLPGLKPYHVRLEYEGGVIEDDILVGIVGSSDYVAGMPMGKMVDASMTDGLMDVILIKNPSSLTELQGILNGFLVGEFNEKYVYCLKSSRMKITADRPVPWSLDGEYGGTRTEVEISNHKQALRILVPERSIKLHAVREV